MVFLDYKAMCIQQGYIPSTCLMDGQMAWLLTNEGKDPCRGCNVNRSECNGRHAPYEDKDYGVMCFLDKWDLAEKKKIEERKRRHEELVEQRKKGHIEGFTRTLLEVRWDRDYHSDGWVIDIAVKDIVDEKAYYTTCKYIDEASHLVQLCCHRYKVEQVHVEINGMGTAIYDEIVKLELPNVDVVPMRYTKIKL